jgi:lysophospholipase L1-like esterase
MRHKPIVAFGDSITRGHTLAPEETWVHFLAQALSEKLGSRAPQVLNAGGNGNTTRDGLQRIQADVLDKNPGLVLVEFGGNDAGHNPIEYPQKHVTLEEFKRNLQEIDTLVSQAGGRAVYLTFPPVIEIQRWPAGAHPFFTPYGGSDAFIGIYREAMRQFAKQQHRSLFDLDLVIRELIKTHGSGVIMAADGVHLTVKCNELLAQALAPRVVEWLGET